MKRWARPMAADHRAAAAMCRPSAVPSEQIAAWHRKGSSCASSECRCRSAAGSYPPAKSLSILPTAPAMLRVAPWGTAVEMPISTGWRRKMRPVGTLAFALNGQPRITGALPGRS